MQQSILVPLDGSDLAEQALPYAEALAEPGRQLILLEVGQDSDEDLRSLERHADSNARLETAVGDPAEEILQVAQDLQVGLIVMTTHGRGALERWDFGSVADQVTRTSPVPVLVVHPREGGDGSAATTIRRLVVPLDGSPLAEEALPTAVSLAKRLNVPVHLVTVIDTAGLVPIELAAAAVSVRRFEETVTRHFTDAQALLAQPHERLQDEGVVTSVEVRHGLPGAAIVDAVVPGDFIVMTSHGRTGLPRWFLGSVAEAVIRHASVPVLLVRPTPSAPAMSAGDASE